MTTNAVPHPRTNAPPHPLKVWIVGARGSIATTLAIGVLYYWTRGKASDAPAPGDAAFPPQEADYR